MNTQTHGYSHLHKISHDAKDSHVPWRQNDSELMEQHDLDSTSVKHDIRKALCK